MIKHILGIAAFCGAVSSLSAETTWPQAHTFFLPRSVSSDILLTRGQNPRGSGLTVDHAVFYKDSDNADQNVGYFLGNGKTSLAIGNDGKQDVHPSWLQVYPETNKTVTSSLTLKPQRRVWGVVMSFAHGLPALHEGAWARMVFPLVEATHKLGVSAPTTGEVQSSGFTSVESAIDRANWKAGKLAKNSQTVRGLDDVLAQFGITFGTKNKQSYYLEACIPVGARPTAHYLFEPLIGSLGHFGLGGGMHTSFNVYDFSPDLSLKLVSNIDYRYSFSAVHNRTMDLVGKPFSRMHIFLDTSIAVGTNYHQYSANGVNFFTRPVLVEPGSQGQGYKAIQLTYKNHTLELGYGYWWRTSEQLSLHTSSTRSFAVPINSSSATSRPWYPSPRMQDEWKKDTAENERTGGYLATEKADAVTNTELDMMSAAAPYTGSQTLAAVYRGAFTVGSTKISCDLGGSYEFAHNGAAFNMWSVWTRVGIQV